MARMSKQKREYFERLAVAISLHCFRNSDLEDLHAGPDPASVTGDYADVMVRSADRDIPWSQVARISDDEMKALMIGVVDRVFTVLVAMEENDALLRLLTQSQREYEIWNKPKLKKGMYAALVAAR